MSHVFQRGNGMFIIQEVTGMLYRKCFSLWLVMIMCILTITRAPNVHSQKRIARLTGGNFISMGKKGWMALLFLYIQHLL